MTNAGEVHEPPRAISVHGAKVHNLKNIDVTVPLRQLVGVAGVSGSGKRHHRTRTEPGEQVPQHPGVSHVPRHAPEPEGTVDAGAWDRSRRSLNESWREAVEVVVMDGFTGFKTATTEELPDAVAVMDPFHVVRLAGDVLHECRRRVQQDTCGRRGRKTDPLYAARRTLHTGADLLTGKQKQRLEGLFATDEHVEVEATWGIYQRMVAAYREPDKTRGRELMVKLIDTASHDVPAALTELRKLGRTLKRRATDVLPRNISS